jgi:hypothetical protein
MLGALETVCEFDEPYHTPAGYYDLPYFYVKNYFIPDTSPLLFPFPVFPPQLVNALNDSIPSDNDSDFILRRVSVVSITSYFNFKDALSYSYFTSNPPDPSANAANNSTTFDTAFSVIPEKLFPPGSAIQYFLGGLGGEIFGALEFGAPTPYVAYFSVIFQGVKRFAGIPDRKANYSYSERGWTHVFPFNLNWFYLIAPYNTYTADNARTFYIPVKDYDFELMQIGVDGGGFQIRLFDANTRALSNDFVDVTVVSATGVSIADAVNCFPVPSIIYPIGSVIRVDIRSLATPGGGTGPVVLYMKGVQRVPC